MYLRVSLTDRCNLRCTYCLPEGARFAREAASSAELHRLTALVVEAAGVSKIRLTGGEPTLVDDLLDHIRQAAELVPTVGLTSNGILLEPMLPALHEAGLQRVNISLDGLSQHDFRAVTRRDGLPKVVAAIHRAAALGFDKVKVNVVAQATTRFADFVRFAAFEGVHLRFIELMAIGEAQAFRDRAYIDAATIRSRLFDDGISLLPASDHDEATARVWRLPDVDPALTSIGFITTTSEPFCGTCNRLRLTSQGRLHTCLFDETGVDLLTPLRAGDDSAVHAAVVAAVAAKAPPAHFIRHGPMASIGG